MDPHARTILAKLDKPVVMIGLMGVGKTKLGGLLAKSLGVPFVDSDQEIEKSAGQSVACIFEEQGEPAFRDMERKVLARLLSEDLKVVATGGGAIMNEMTADLIWNSAISIWLKADLDVLVERTGRNGKRPLLKNGNPRDILQGLMDKRYPIYENADIVVESTDQEVDKTLAVLLKTLADHLEKTEISPP